MARPKKYPDELIQRGVRLALEGDRPIAPIAHGLVWAFIPRRCASAYATRKRTRALARSSQQSGT